MSRVNNFYIKAVAPLKVYYNRPAPQQTTSYETYDEGWLYQNGFDSASLTPEDAILQQQDLSVSPDYLKYFNSFGHKFRFTGLNGGYYDFNDSTYKDVTGGTSSFDTEFRNPVSGGANQGYIIDHLTGIGHFSSRGGSGGINFSNQWVNGATLFLWSDWFNPPAIYILTLVRYDLASVLQSSRPPFNWDQQWAWTSTSLISTPTVNALRFDVINGALTAVIKTSTGSSNRCYMRLHYTRTDYVIQT